MTTYIGTKCADGTWELITRPYCSAECVPLFVAYHPDDNYEFDESCANCGAFIPGRDTFVWSSEGVDTECYE